MQSTLNSWNARPGGSQGFDGPDLGRSIHQLMGRPRDGRCAEAPSENARWQGDSGLANYPQAHSEVAAHPCVGDRGTAVRHAGNRLEFRCRKHVIRGFSLRKKELNQCSALGQSVC